VAPRDEMHACEFCNYGKKAVAGPTHECVSCGASTYSLGGTDECSQCTGVGKFSTEGAAYCQTALAGTKANEGRTDFEICPIDTFSEVSEVAEERTDGEQFINSFTTKGETDECSPCEDGEYSNRGSASCEGCEGGKYYDVDWDDGDGGGGRRNQGVVVLEEIAEEENSKMLTDIVELDNVSDDSGGQREHNVEENVVDEENSRMLTDIAILEVEIVELDGVSDDGRSQREHNVEEDVDEENDEMLTENMGEGDIFEEEIVDKREQGHRRLDCSSDRCVTSSFGSCDSCNYGDYLDRDGINECCSCAPGKQQSSNTFEGGSCTNCEPGKFSGESARICTNCGAGTYSPSSGATSSTTCTACASGKYSSDVGATSIDTCVNCPAGTYSENRPAVNALACTECAPGKYSEDPGAYAPATCLSCAAGKFSDTEGANSESFCELCSEGKFSVTPGATDSSTCSFCVDGKMSSAGESSCIDCAAGKKSVIDFSRCDPCSSGMFSSAGASTCTSCNSGYIPVSDSSTCVACAAGKFANSGYRATECLPCPEPTFSLEEGAISCDTSSPTLAPTAAPSDHQPSAAPTNFPSASPSTSAPTINFLARCPNCPAGRFSPDGAKNLAGCAMCDGQGEFSPPGSLYCHTAEAGTIPKQPDRSGVIYCPVNTASVGATDACTECGFGQFSSLGSAVCSTAGAGKKPNAVRDGEEPCPINTFSVGANDTCTGCGDSHSDIGASSCIDTPPGYYFHTTTNTDLQCPAGTFSEDGASSLSGCGACDDGKGQFSDVGSAYCSTAGAGKVPNAQRSAEEPCPINTFSVGASSYCTNCQNSHSDVGSSSCTPTPPGYFFDNATNTDIPCPKGTYSATGATSLAHCLTCSYSGEYSAAAGSTYCSTVGAGKASNKNHTNYEICPVNHFSIGATNNCTLCDGGHSTPGSASCVDTPPGHYFDPLAHEDFPCPKGRFSTDGASTFEGCEPCSGAGEFANQPGSSYCRVVGVGTFPNENRDSPLNCTIGKFSLGAADVCQTCENGKFSRERASGCETCYAGYVPNDTGDGCWKCEMGKFALYSASECIPCPDGFVSPPTGERDYCQVCSAGTVSDATHSNCNECPAGKFSGTAASVCEACELGKFNNVVNQPACKLCPANEESQIDFTDCQCKHGFVLDTNTTRCVCPPGFTYDFGACVPCGLSLFKEEIGLEPCIACNKHAVLGSFSTAGEAVSRYNCSCAVNEYLNPRKDIIPFHGECKVCPEGALCSHPANELESLLLDKGWWRSASNSNKTVECYTKDACEQSQRELYSNNNTAGALFNYSSQCAEGHFGPICGRCENFYTMSVIGKCEHCNDEVVVPYQMMIFIFLVTLLISVFVYKALQRSKARKQLEAEEAKNRGSEESTSTKIVRMRRDKKHWTHKMKTKFKIFTSFFQIVSQFENILQIRLPDVFENFAR